MPRLVLPDTAQLVILLLVVALVGLFWYFQRSPGNGYNFLDTFDDTNGKTSIGAHFAWILFVIAVWLIINEAAKDSAKAWDWTFNALLASLGYKAINSGITAAAKRPMITTPPSQGDNIAQQVVMPETAQPATSKAAVKAKK